MKGYTKEILEIKGIYTYDEFDGPAYKLGYFLGASSWSSNLFDKELNVMENTGIIKKIYDFTEGDFREALFELENGNEISFFGTNHMDYKLNLLIY